MINSVILLILPVSIDVLQ